MSSVCGVLGSTPPGSYALPTPSPASRPASSKRPLVSFRSGTSDYEATGSLKSGLARSVTADGASLSRSLGARRGADGFGGFASVGASGSARAAAARPLQATVSIPKSAAFVKVEGFDTRDSSPAGSAPPSPQQPRVLSSLLSRQLSTDRLPSLGASLANTPSAPSALGAAVPAPGLEHLAARLESAVRAAPAPRPPTPQPRPRTTVPDDLLQQLQREHSVFAEPVCVRAFGIARAAHDGRARASGEPALHHCVEVARILAAMGADEGTVSAALLHDALDETLLVEAQLRPMLGDDAVADLVKQVAHLGDISSKYRACPATSPQGQAATAAALVGMLVAMGANHALLVKLADRLHDMRTLDALPAAKRNRLARETIDVWAPLANRLGVWSLKAQLEDLAFKQLCPTEYAELAARLEAVQSADVLVGLVDRLRSELQRQGVSYHDLSGRPKHLWGVHRKMAAKGYPLGRVSDVRGLRIIVDSKEECYRALRAVETAWRPVGPTKDYIRRPKDNGYRSLHTVVRGDDGHDIEVQIRTAKMHYFAEYGADAAHWQYKERGYGTAPAAPAAPAAALASRDDAGGAAREANWAKWVLSQQVHDQKFRPSGSPGQDTSLASIVGGPAAAPGERAAAAAAAAASPPSSSSSEGTSPASSPPRDARFAAYLEKSGQVLAPPAEERVVVAVVRGGGLEVAELPAGSRVACLLAAAGVRLPEAQVLVNGQLESSAAARIRTGDIVELYEAEAATVPAARPLPGVLAARQAPHAPAVAVDSPLARPPAKAPLSAGRSNVVPLGALRTARLRSAAADAAA